MRRQNRFLNGLGLILFFAGVLVGMVFFAGLTWANLEADFYFGPINGAETKLNLTCPHILTPQDSGAVTATIANKAEKTIEPTFEAEFSGPGLRTASSQPSIDPGKTQVLRWAVTAGDVDFGHLIMAQVYQSAAYNTPTAGANCGTLFLTIPTLTGSQVYILVLVFSLLGIVIGIVLWRFGNGALSGRIRENFWGMVFLGSVVLLGIVFGSVGLWIFGVFTLALCVLMVVVIINRWLIPA